MKSKACMPFAAQPVAVWSGGTTRAIYAYPHDHWDQLAAAHIWVGTATIERDCAYSVFPERTRIHMPLHGGGLQLHFQQPEKTVALSNFGQATFAGDRPLEVTLQDGAIQAFNLIFHPTVRADLRVLHLTAADGVVSLSPSSATLEPPAQIVQVVYAVSGTCSVQRADAQALLLQPGDAFVSTPDDKISALFAAEMSDLILATLVWSPNASEKL